MEECPEDMRSVLAGGVVVGWTADVAVILWRRMLGALGDVNQIQDPEIHARVYECMCDLLDTMLKVGKEQITVVFIGNIDRLAPQQIHSRT